MKIGNQFYLEFQLEDENGDLLDIRSVSKVQFTIDNLVKTYDGTNEEVSYDDANNVFKVWLTEDETFKFGTRVKVDARILFKNNTINGAKIQQYGWYDTLKKVNLDV